MSYCDEQDKIRDIINKMDKLIFNFEELKFAERAITFETYKCYIEALTFHLNFKNNILGKLAVTVIRELFEDEGEYKEFKDYTEEKGYYCQLLINYINSKDKLGMEIQLKNEIINIILKNSKNFTESITAFLEELKEIKIKTEYIYLLYVYLSQNGRTLKRLLEMIIPILREKYKNCQINLNDDISPKSSFDIFIQKFSEAIKEIKSKDYFILTFNENKDDFEVTSEEINEIAEKINLDEKKKKKRKKKKKKNINENKNEIKKNSEEEEQKSNIINEDTKIDFKNDHKDNEEGKEIIKEDNIIDKKNANDSIENMTKEEQLYQIPKEKDVKLLNNVDLSKQFAELKEEFNNLKADNNKLKEENNKLREDNNKIKEDNKKLKEEVNIIKKENNTIKEENNTLKKNLENLEKKYNKTVNDLNKTIEALKKNEAVISNLNKKSYNNKLKIQELEFKINCIGLRDGFKSLMQIIIHIFNIKTKGNMDVKCTDVCNILDNYKTKYSDRLKSFIQKSLKFIKRFNSLAHHIDYNKTIISQLISHLNKYINKTKKNDAYVTTVFCRMNIEKPLKMLTMANNNRYESEELYNSNVKEVREMINENKELKNLLFLF